MNDKFAWGTAARVTAVVLALLMAVTCLPMLGHGDIYADGEDEEQYRDVKLSKEEMKELGLEEGETVTLSENDETNIEAQEKALQEIAEKEGAELIDEDSEVKEEEKLTSVDAEAAPESEEQEIQVTQNLAGNIENGEKGMSLQAINPSYIKVGKPNKDGYLHVIIDIPQEYRPYYSINSLYMDNYTKLNFNQNINGWSYLDATINMKDYAVGYHDLYIYYNDAHTGKADYIDVAKWLPTYIYGAPSNSISDYRSTTKKIGKKGGYSSYSPVSGNSEYLDVYMQYKKAKKKSKWSKKIYKIGTSYGTVYNIPKKLKSNTKYKVRLLYGKTFEYGGKKIFMSGTWTGKYSKAKSIYTGMSKKQLKKKIKSIKIKAKVKSYKYLRTTKITAYWWGYREHFKRARAYYTIYTPTVRFKKKPKLAGIFLKTKYGTDWKKGNKKKYSVKFLESGRKKRKKFSISVKACKSNNYDGYSKWYKKRVRSH